MWNLHSIEAFARTYYGPAQVGGIALKALGGGLASRGVARVIVTSNERRNAGSFVVKLLEGESTRELNILKYVNQLDEVFIAPRLLGSARVGARQEYAFLEWIPPVQRWPWSKTDRASLVIERLAVIHEWSARPLARAFAGWNYGAELGHAALLTVDAYRGAASAGMHPGRRPMQRTIERLAAAAETIRNQVIAFTGATIVHGDAHPGNVLLRMSHAAESVVFVDWARARVGSPLEDVCSWIDSAGFWEPGIRRIHDTLLRRYLEAHGMNGALSTEFRDACHLVRACNALSGALLYHTAVLQDPTRTARERNNSTRAAADWLRILRRADACWRN